MLCSQPFLSAPNLLNVFHLKAPSHRPWGLSAPSSLSAFPTAELPPKMSLPPPLLTHPQPSGVLLPPKLPLEKLAHEVLQNWACRLVTREPEVAGGCVVCWSHTLVVVALNRFNMCQLGDFTWTQRRLPSL